MNAWYIQYRFKPLGAGFFLGKCKPVTRQVHHVPPLWPGVKIQALRGSHAVVRVLQLDAPVPVMALLW